jgi:hypothetical protein
MELLQRAELEKFLTRLNQEPNPKEIFKTPDGKASDLPISYVEMTLDELYYGLWAVRNFKANLIANEVVGELELEVFHPVTQTWITRTGAACIQIMVDAVPDSIKDNRQQKNQWALNPDNKKSNALDMAYPKLKTECIKNAAKTLGKIFGRDLNRKEKVDTYKPAIVGNEASKAAVVKRAVLLGNLNEAENLMALFPELSVEKKEELRELIRNAKTSLVAA